MQQQGSREPSREELSRNVYDVFMEQEGIPIFENLAGVHDVTELPRRPWARMGGSGTFIQLWSMIQAERGIYVAEIPGGGALNPEKHMYEEAIIIVQGRGITEVWQEGGEKVTFEWGQGSVFAPPRNTWHRLINGSREPALFLGVTTAPYIMEGFHDVEFVFNCAHQFLDLFGGQTDYFTPGNNRYKVGRWAMHWDTNFIPDVRQEFLDDLEQKVSGGQITVFQMGHFPTGHVAEWPVGRYQKAHYHGSGALLIGFRGQGYSILWPHEKGYRPYQEGHADEVIQIDWGTKSIYTPPEGWFHMHFNTGKEPTRQLAIHTRQTPRPSLKKWVGDDPLVLVSTYEGGTVLDYEDEDPEIRRRFVEALRPDGIECTMPPVVYRS